LEKSLYKHNEGDTHAEPADQSVDIGKQLRRARESGNLSIQSVAASLRLAPRVIIALEENDFGQFQPVFVKGYLRNYGRLLNLPSEPLVESYSRSILPEQDTLQSPRPSATVSTSPWVLYLLLLVGILTIVVWGASKMLFPVDEVATSQSEGVAHPLSLLPTQTADGNAVEPSPASSENGLTADVTKGQSDQAGDKAGSPMLADKPTISAATTANQFIGPPIPESTKIQDDKTASANLQGMASPSPTSQAGSLGPDAIAIHLATTAWVGIRDHTGRRLVYKKIPAGTDYSFSGQAPFLVVLGNPPATKIEFNGKPFTPPKSKAGAVARFTIGQSNAPEAGGSTAHKRP
jgi:cytoskeleton protein RodZ